MSVGGHILTSPNFEVRAPSGFWATLMRAVHDAHEDVTFWMLMLDNPLGSPYRTQIAMCVVEAEPPLHREPQHQFMTFGYVAVSATLKTQDRENALADRVLELAHVVQLQVDAARGLGC